MKHVKDFLWRPGISCDELLSGLKYTGFQATQLAHAKDVILKMKKSGAKIILTFTSNMVSSGLRGLFAQLVSFGIVDIIVTTVGSIEEDIMKSLGEKFIVGKFHPDDFELYEKGINRVGNIFIRNESYLKFEEYISNLLKEIYLKKPRISPSELFREIGSTLEDENSILRQAYLKKVPIFCPGITDGAFGFHLFMIQQKYRDFCVDVVKDFSNIILSLSYDDRKGLICLGGGISKHHAILAALLNGGLDYAVYLTTARPFTGSMSGATTDEAKSWGKIKDDSDAVSVIGDVSITFPLLMCAVLEELHKEGYFDQ